MRSSILAAFLLVSLGASTAMGAGTLVVCNDIRDPATLDPQHEFSEKDHTVVQQIYDGLVRFSPDGKIEPALATSWEAITPLRMRFTLRQGVTFHNGEPFDAEAVRFTIQRYLDRSKGFPAIGFLDPFVKAEVVDPYTVDIITSYPDGLMLNRLAGFVLIVPPKLVAQKGEDWLNEHPVGTGAFQFESWTKGKELVLVANKHYWLAGCPKLDKLVFRAAPADEQPKLLLSGQVDLVTELPGTFTMEVTRNTGTRIVKDKAFWTVGATMNVSSGPLADVRVRKALNLAINRADLIRFDTKGNATPLASLTMEGEQGHNPDLAPYPYDPEQARKLLAEAGVKTPLVLKTMVHAYSLRTGNILAAQFKKIGVELNIRDIPSDTEVIHHLASEPWDIAIAAVPDPMYHSFFIQTILLFSKSPCSIERNPEFDKRLGQMVTELDPVKRETLGRQLDAYVYDQNLSLFTYQKVKTYGMSAKVDFKPYRSGMPYFYMTSVSGRNTLAANDPDSTRAVSDAGAIP